MQNLRILSSSGHSAMHPSYLDLTGVSPSHYPGVTTINPTHTSVTPLAHINLSRKQALVLDFLINNISHRTNYSSIGHMLGLTKSAARDAVMQLVSKKYILRHATVRDGIFQGVEYILDGAKCQQFLQAGGTANEKYHFGDNTVTPLPHTVCSPSVPDQSLSSSNIDLKLTTVVNLDDPELLWWSDQGLSPIQIKRWLAQFKMNAEDLTLSLRYARFDFVENKKKAKGVVIESPIDYFYGVLKNAGRYVRPTNYKSLTELRAEELQDQQKRDEDARKKIWHIEIEDKLKKLLKDPESPLYRELLENVDDFTKANQFALEIKMREFLKEKNPM